MKILLVPTPISETATAQEIERQLPAGNREKIAEIRYFVVENLRTARRFLAAIGLREIIDLSQFVELSEHTTPEQIDEILKPILGGEHAALLSEAGLPCVADPGSSLVRAAHDQKVEIIPLVGPSSLMLALMASGASGQSFAFNGYLPIKEPQRTKSLREALTALAKGQTQIFIETPYRNAALLDFLIQSLPTQTKLTLAAGLMTPAQIVVSQQIAEWRAGKGGRPDKKTPTIFIIG